MSEPTHPCAGCFERILDLTGQREQLRAQRDALLAAAKWTLDVLHCASANDGRGTHEMAPGEFAYGHWCNRCDEYADRNGELRAALRAAIAEVEAK